jgi:C4-dicarboxylate-specific signal transduction histidine kinase
LFQFEPTAHLNHATMQERVHPEDRVPRDAAVKRALETHGEYEIEYRLLLPDGSIRWIGGRGRCLSNADGRLTRLLGVSMDVTNRKLAEAQARQQREELEHLSRVAVMGEMATSIAHELNQPLSGIVSNAGAGQRFIDRGDVDLRELRALLVDISADGRRAGEVVRGIRRMVKKEETRRQSVDLNDVVMNVAHMIGPDALLHSCKVRTSLKPNLPRVEADPIQIQQVLINLVVNGFDAMHDTPVQNREILMETERHGNGVIEVSVRDYGVGIPDEARERLFDRFFTTKREGLGMGLAIVRSIVEAHHGTIAAENAAGGGARFHFTLPINVSH